MNGADDQITAAKGAASGDEATGSAPNEQKVELDQLATQFTARIEGRRELLDVIAPHVAALDEPAGLEKVISRSELSEHGKEVIKTLFVSPEPDADEAKAPVVRLEPQDEKLPPDAKPVPPEKLPPEIKAFTTLVQEEPGGVIRIMQRMSRGAIAPRSSLLHGSLLTVAVASFEFLVAGLFSFHLIAFPNQLKDDDQEFSLADLVELGSIEEARRLLIERRVDGFMRKGLGDWSRWSERILGQPFSELTLEFDHLNELFQRRHIVVHSGGAVSRLYLERVAHSDEPPRLGEELPVSSEYLHSALDELEVLGHSMLALARRKWNTTDSDRAAQELNATVYDLLRAQRWQEARKLAEVGCQVASSDSSKWMLTVNGWLASRGSGDLSGCRDEIEKWDVSALAPEFKLARACLLDESDRAFEQLERTLKETKGRLRPIWQWPLLDGLREDPRLGEIFNEFGFSPDNPESDDLAIKPPPFDPGSNPRPVDRQQDDHGGENNRQPATSGDLAEEEDGN